MKAAPDSARALAASPSQASSQRPRQTPRDIDAAREERVPMSKLRRVIAGRLKEAQNNAAMLTTFNEVDMTELMALRINYRTEFENTHQVRLGFMGMFVQASVMALREFPAVNAEIDGNDIIYKNYYNIGVAVGTPQGLVVPVIKGAEAMNLAEVERTIGDFGMRARDGKIAPDDMARGTFTISNGGVYGSLMSTPILNPPQSGILGMHKIEKRAVVVDDAIVIRPMMYLALSYDHRIIDGREAVSFLARVKDLVEDPRRLLIGV
jgi:2-oxoglutarate dehydrogenase E2 component (dihydrolipoamide succinyltransferase)